LLGCSGNDLSFKYEIYTLNSSTNQWLKFTQPNYFYVSNQLGSDLTLREILFSKYSSEKNWKIELNVFIASRNVSGKSSITFVVNFPPRLGYCLVDPQNGSTVIPFNIKCSNWRDPEGSPVNFAYYGTHFICQN